jgi:hypothetical protein
MTYTPTTEQVRPVVRVKITSMASNTSVLGSIKLKLKLDKIAGVTRPPHHPHEIRQPPQGEAVTIPQEAIEAAAEALTPGLFTLTDHHYGIRFDNSPELRAHHQEDARDEARAVLTAALPTIEQQIRRRMAEEIRKAKAEAWREGVEYLDGALASVYVDEDDGSVWIDGWKQRDARNPYMEDS